MIRCTRCCKKLTEGGIEVLNDYFCDKDCMLKYVASDEGLMRDIFDEFGFDEDFTWDEFLEYCTEDISMVSESLENEITEYDESEMREKMRENYLADMEE